MKQSTELTKIIAAVRNAVNYEEDVLGYKVTFKNSEVEEALEDLGYVLNFKEGSKKKKMFYHLTEGDKPQWVPADEGSMLDAVGGYILSRREEENYLANPEKKADERKAAGELETRVDDAVKPKEGTTEVIPAPKGRSTWAYWGIGLITAAVALRFLYNACVPAVPERSHQETVPAAEYSALQEDCNQLGADLSRCTRSLNAATYDPRGQSASAIVDSVKSYIDGTKEDLYLGPGCGNAAKVLYALMNGVPEGRATFLRALESSWKPCEELVQSPTKVIHYK